ncbi:hypothetical protein NQ314_002388 [Rhamnusium bicolor]|uniref:RNA-directed DNA polymerase n=1 Tax=Rhamnusium bicolor TaxID=1586634 RepID=A0AAV8ZS19_9CUCU|nr:hypothetical protein NQ314_002388 [Rhamnusium bicolor]
MARKITINKLDKDELSYELTVRGISTGNVEEMRSRLSMAFKMEKSGDSLKYPNYPFTFDEDYDAVKEKLDVLERLILDFDMSPKSGEALKVQTKLAYTLGRLDNMVIEDGENLKKKSDLLARTLSLMDKFNGKLEAHDEKNQDTPPIVGILERNLERDTFNEGIGNISRSSAVEELTRPSTSGSTKSIPPNKWNIKFSGNLREMSLSAFLEQVEELRIARHVSKETLLDSGIDLFSGKAFSFYQDIRRYVNSWEELIEEFKLEFRGTRHDEELLKEIENRTQAKDESIGIYLAIMSSYFNRLTYSISEKAKLAILLRNIRPSLQQGIGLREVSSIGELRVICRKLGEKNVNMENFREPPPRRANTLEPDLAYVEEVTEKVNTRDLPTPHGSGKSKEIICFKCRKPGHKAVGCTLVKKMHCFRCKREGYTVRTCPDCAGSGKRTATLLGGRTSSVATGASTTRIVPVLDFILDHAKDDERPYLEVDILGTKLLGLLDSGATCTILGNEGWKLVGRLGISIDPSQKTMVTVANGEKCTSIGKCTLPMRVRNRVVALDVIVVPELPRMLILGQDFWIRMGIVPDLRSKEWQFSENPDVFSIQQVKDQTVLSHFEQIRLQAVIDRNVELMGWRVADNKLYKYVKQDYPELAKGMDFWKLVVPKSDRGRLISSAHDPPICGHMGVYKTYSRLTEKYYWPKMRYDIANYIRKCNVCTAHKPSNKSPADMMVSHLKVDRPWEMISTDIMGPLPRSKKGNSFILVVTDYLSKFALVFALRTASTENIIRKIREEVFLIFGVARKVICDNGPQFRSKKFADFAGEFKFDCKYNANYHARANPTERTNGTIKIMMSMNMMLSGEDYSKDVILEVEDGNQTNVRKRLEEAGKRSCARYNLRKRYEEFKPGQLVWKKNYTLSNAGNYYSAKLAPKYVGPYYINEKVSPWTYILRDRDAKILKGTWHIKDLKSAPTSEN